MSEIITVIATIVTTFTTISLALLTWRYVALTQQMATSMESAREPFVDIELNLPEFDFRLAFVNAGGTAARNITFRVDQDCEIINGHTPGERGISNVHPIRTGISYLPAGQRLLYSVGHCPADISTSENRILQITISYHDDSGRQYNRTVRYDLQQIDHLLFESFQNTHLTVAKAIRDVSRSFENRNSLNGIYRINSKSHCQFCSESVKKSAKKCPHCLEWLTSEAVSTAAPLHGANPRHE